MRDRNGKDDDDDDDDDVWRNEEDGQETLNIIIY